VTASHPAGSQKLAGGWIADADITFGIDRENSVH
jgi:hypothetical protein